MSLVLFAWVTSNSYFADLTDIDIREKLYDNQMKQIEEELTPFGLIINGTEEETFIEDGDLWTIVKDSNRSWI
jgi:hypothetical protein